MTVAAAEVPGFKRTLFTDEKHFELLPPPRHRQQPCWPSRSSRLLNCVVKTTVCLIFFSLCLFTRTEKDICIFCWGGGASLLLHLDHFFIMIWCLTSLILWHLKPPCLNKLTKCNFFINCYVNTLLYKMNTFLKYIV